MTVTQNEIGALRDVHFNRDQLHVSSFMAQGTRV
jgi:hypothetical protein